jgi:transposase
MLPASRQGFQVIWVQRFEETGSVAAKPSGGSTSPLEQHAEFLLGLIADQPDLTLDEIIAAMRKRRIAGSRSAVWRFFARRNISFKKNSVRGGAEACRRRPRTPALDARARHV